MPVGTPQFKGEELGIPFGPTNFFEMFVGPQVPDPITFVLGEKWLNRPHMLYPRQATLLKVIFLRDDLFTAYDNKVIDEWEESFRLTGTRGISPGIRERITWLKEEGAKWFREVLLVMGRRAGKGYVSGVALSYVIWNYMARGNPQEYYGIDRDKRISCLVFAGKRDQAKATVFGDVVNAITSSTCFAPYISKTQTESMTLYAPSDFIRMDNMRRKGIKTQRDIASLEILPKESTPMAGRGPSAFTLAFDEMAHVVTGSGTSSNADAVYSSAKPALDQFGADSFIIEPSSPWQMMGQFYENYKEAIALDDDGKPTRPNYMMIQLPSWSVYEDWEISENIPVFPEGYEGDLGEYKDAPHPKFPKIKRAIQVFDDEMRREKLANPETFAVEREAQWAAAVGAYLNAEKVDEIFQPWLNRPEQYGPPHLEIQNHGLLMHTYMGHADPSKINDKFGYCLGHAERDAQGRLHAVIDQVGHFDPADFPNHIIDYEYVDNWIWDNLITQFYPEEFTFDQYSSGPSIQKLTSRVRQASFPKRVTVFEQTAVRSRDWEVKETTKAAINMGLVHSPMNERFRDEARFVQLVNGRVDHPNSGPVQSKDIFDAACEVVYKLIGLQTKELISDGMSAFKPALMGMPEPFPQMSQSDPESDVFARLRGGGGGGMRNDPTYGGVWRGREGRR